MLADPRAPHDLQTYIRNFTPDHCPDSQHVLHFQQRLSKELQKNGLFYSTDGLYHIIHTFRLNVCIIYRENKLGQGSAALLIRVSHKHFTELCNKEDARRHVDLAACSACSELSMLNDIFVVKATITASAVGGIMTSQRQSAGETSPAWQEKKRRKCTNTQNLRWVSAVESERGRVLHLRTDVRGSGSAVLDFKELRCNNKPTVDLPKQGRGWWFAIFPFFSSGPLRSSLVFLRRAGASRAELSDPSDLHRFYSCRSHKRDSPLFLDADAAAETLQNPPERTEDENINTTEVKATHFLNFLPHTTDVGSQTTTLLTTVPKNTSSPTQGARFRSLHDKRESWRGIQHQPRPQKRSTNVWRLNAIKIRMQC